MSNYDIHYNIADKIITLKLQEFLDYFLTYIHPEIHRTGEWLYREKYGRTFDEMNNNICESMNACLKQMQEWREAPVDTFISMLHVLFNSYNVEFTRERFI